MQKMILEKFKESALSVLPVTILVSVFAAVLTDIELNVIWLFLIGSLLLILGMALFTMGADLAMMPMGSSVGTLLSKTKKGKFWQVVLIGLVIGFVVTMAEPDLLVLSQQLGNGSVNIAIWLSVAAGVGIFLLVSLIRTFFNIKLTTILLVSYSIVFALGIAVTFVNPQFLALAFDSGGVNTGPITVPFLMSLGLSLAAVKGSKNNSDSFGMLAICSIGPVIAIMVLGLTGSAQAMPPEVPQIMYNDFGEIMSALGRGAVEDMINVLIALGPIVVLFFFFQLFSPKIHKSQLIRILVGLLYTFVGLTIFLTGVNVGFQPMGYLLGADLASKSYSYILLPVGIVLGCLIVLAEPAIYVLNKQVEEVTGGAISRRSMLVFLCVGVGVAVGLSMLRVLTGISMWYFLAPIYIGSLILMFFVPPIFTGIAFDSGGVASGTMTAAFLLPIAVGACTVLGGDILTDAYGMVAFVAMTPLITIQLMGLVYKLKTKRLIREEGNILEPLPADFDKFETVEFYDSETDTIIADDLDDNGESGNSGKTGGDRCESGDMDATN